MRIVSSELQVTKDPGGKTGFCPSPMTGEFQMLLDSGIKIVFALLSILK